MRMAVSLLAKYGFDLRKKLGTVLRTKFDFTSVAGIRQTDLGLTTKCPVGTWTAFSK